MGSRSPPLPAPPVLAACTEALAPAPAALVAQACSLAKVWAQGPGGRLSWGLGARAPTEPDFLLLPLGPISEEGLGASVASLSSENPYATIRDLPSLLGSPRESSYVEMKGPPAGSPPRQPAQVWDSQGRRHPQPQRDSGTYEEPSPLTYGEHPFPCWGRGAGGGQDGVGGRTG